MNKQYDYTMLVNHVSELVAKVSGNRFGEKQKHMVETRLKKRMIDMGFESPDDYLNYVKKNTEKEIDFLVSLLTTHHTFFFREFSQFEYLANNLPTLIEEVKKRGEKKLRILTLACSRGHETYSVAMFLAHHLENLDSSMDFEIHATDIDRESISFAANGVYRYEEIKSIPLRYLGKNWARGKGDISDFAKVKEVLKQKCTFETGNLLNLEKELSGKKYDVTFCRNVFIYFENDQIAAITKVILNHLYDKGIFFTGISESLNHLKLELKNLAPSTYTHKIADEEVLPKTATQVVPVKKKIRLLCVDDSSTVLVLLKKIFANSDEFEIVGTAKSGIEAEAFLKENQVDAMTLDIHMPEMDGITYLEKNFRFGHPAVVMVSSASREDSTHATRALELGASDFVEKPSLNNIDDKKDEIATKLKVAVYNKNSRRSSSLASDFDRDFARKADIEKPHEKCLVAFGSMVDKKSILQLVRSYKSNKNSPALFIVTEGNNNILPSFLENLKKEEPFVNYKLYDNKTVVENNTVYLLDFDTDIHSVKSEVFKKESVSIVLGRPTDKVIQTILSLPTKLLLLEDLGELTSEKLAKKADDITPVTSFIYLGLQHFVKVGV